MRILKTIILITFLFNISNLGLAQKLSFDNYKISFKVFVKQSQNMHGYKSELYSGIIKVKGKNTQKGEYPFYYAGIGKSQFMLGVKNNENKVLSPKIYYDEDSRTLSYKNDSGDEISKTFDTFTPTEEIVLYAMQLWLKSKTD